MRRKNFVPKVVKSSKNFSFYLVRDRSSHGFTVIEILVALTILVALAAGALFTINPFKQIERAQDAKKADNLKQLKNAVSLYYQDTNCYPTSVSNFNNQLVSGGSTQWTEGGEVYMQELPDNSDQTFSYITDPADPCPQWNVLFTKLSDGSQGNCPLSQLSQACVPEDYDSTYSCELSGAVACDILSSGDFASLVGAIPTPTSPPTPTVPGPTATPTPTPTPSPTPPGTVVFALNNPPGSNPDPYQLTVAPLYQTLGNAQSVEIVVASSTPPITEVIVTLFADTQDRQFNLNGNLDGSVWSGTWQVTDTYYDHYGMTITAVDEQNHVTEHTVWFRQE